MVRKRARSYPSYGRFLADVRPLPSPLDERTRAKLDREKPVGQVCVVCGQPRTRYAQYERCNRCRDQYLLDTTPAQRKQDYPDD